MPISSSYRIRTANEAVKKPVLLAGHRRSGTNFATAVLRANLDAEVQASDQHKHELYCNHPTTRPLIYIYRFPFDTFSSLYDWGSRHWFNPNVVTRMQFLRAGPVTGDGVKSGEGAVSYWKRHVSGWLEQADTKSLIALRYEDFLLRGDWVMEDVSKKLGFPRHSQYQPVPEGCGPTGLRQPPRHCYTSIREFSKSEIDLILHESGGLIQRYWPEWSSMKIDFPMGAGMPCET
jgi:hypothetical protein